MQSGDALNFMVSLAEQEILFLIHTQLTACMVASQENASITIATLASKHNRVCFYCTETLTAALHFVLWIVLFNKKKVIEEEGKKMLSELVSLLISGQYCQLGHGQEKKFIQSILKRDTHTFLITVCKLLLFCGVECAPTEKIK